MRYLMCWEGRRKKYSVLQIVEVELVAQSDKADLVKSNHPHLDS